MAPPSNSEKIGQLEERIKRLEAICEKYERALRLLTENSSTMHENHPEIFAILDED